MAIRVTHDHFRRAFPLSPYSTVLFHVALRGRNRGRDTLLYCFLYYLPNKFGFDVNLMFREIAHDRGGWRAYNVINIPYGFFMADIL